MLGNIGKTIDKFFNKSTQEDKAKVDKNNQASWSWSKGILNFDGTGKLMSDLDKAQFLKGVKNFVKILTNKNIPVKYSTSDESFTDGKEITLSGLVKEENLDSTVGLALHEASHIELSDFTMIKNLLEYPERLLSSDLKQYNFIIKDLFNWVEDRRIDDWVYTTAPGYRPYYSALYDRYFNSPETTKLIIERTKEGPKKTAQDYFFYIFNSLNDEVKGDELPDLGLILGSVLNLSDVKRMTSSNHTLKVAEDIFRIILKHVPKQDMDKFNQESKDSAQGKGGKGGGGKGTPMTSDELQKELEKALKNGDLEKAIKAALDKQRKFGAGQLDKEKVSDTDARRIQVLANCDTNTETVKLGDNTDSTPPINALGAGANWHGKSRGRGEWEVVTVNKIDFEAIETEAFGIFRSNEHHAHEVNEGIILGRMLANKLKQRIEEKETKNPRLKSGKIDKRLLHTCGFNNEAIFYNINIDKYEQLNIHISLDLSGSMSGRKWSNTLISTVSLLSACAKIKNIRTQLSLRYSGSLGASSAREQAFVIQFYDSKFDKESKIKWLKHVTPSGCTPEGLCYEALMKKILSPIMNRRTIFINYSDGQPFMGSMDTDAGVQITKQAIRKMRAAGVQILSFFITDGGHEGYGAKDQFQEMYGKDATTISVTSLIPLAKELNSKFLSK